MTYLGKTHPTALTPGVRLISERGRAVGPPLADDGEMAVAVGHLAPGAQVVRTNANEVDGYVVFRQRRYLRRSTKS